MDVQSMTKKHEVISLNLVNKKKDHIYGMGLANIMCKSWVWNTETG